MTLKPNASQRKTGTLTSYFKLRRNTHLFLSYGRVIALRWMIQAMSLYIYTKYLKLYRNILVHRKRLDIAFISQRLSGSV